MMQAIKAVKVPCGVSQTRRPSRLSAMKAVRFALPWTDASVFWCSHFCYVHMVTCMCLQCT